MPHAPRPKTEDGLRNVIGPRAKERRIEIGITHDAVCGRIAEKSKGTWIPERRDIYKIEKRLRTVIDVELLLLAEALECSPAWLLTGSG